MKAVLLYVSLGLALSACSERPQTASEQKSIDAPLYAGGVKVFTDAGWKPGDKASWVDHLKVRTQRGQNDYYGSNN